MVQQYPRGRFNSSIWILSLAHQSEVWRKSLPIHPRMLGIFLLHICVFCIWGCFGGLIKLKFDHFIKGTWTFTNVRYLWGSWNCCPEDYLKENWLTSLSLPKVAGSELGTPCRHFVFLAESIWNINWSLLDIQFEI